MAAIQTAYAETVTDVVNSDAAVWTDLATLAASNFTAGKKYLILAIADIRLASASSEANARLVHGATPTVFTDSDYVLDYTTATTQGYIAGWLFTFDQPGGGAEDVKIQFKRSGTSNATCRFSCLFVMNLTDNLVENTDWFYNEDTVDYTTTTTMTAKASASVTPNGTDDWLVIGNAVFNAQDATTQRVMAQIHDSVLDSTTPMWGGVAEDATNEKRGHLLLRPFVAPSNAARTWSVRVGHETGASAAGTVYRTAIFALKLNKFQQHVAGYTEGALSLTGGGTWDTAETESVTPTTTGNWFFIACSCLDVAGTTDSVATRLQHNNSGSLVSSPNYGDDAPELVGNDAADTLPTAIMSRFSLTSGASRTVNFDLLENAGTVSASNRALVGFSMELGSSGQTITLGRLDRTRVMNQPTLTPGAVTITLARLDRTRQLFALTIQLAPQTLTLSRLDRTRSLFTPTLTPGAVTISLPGGLAHTRQLFAPTVGEVAPPVAGTQAYIGFRDMDWGEADGP